MTSTPKLEEGHTPNPDVELASFVEATVGEMIKYLYESTDSIAAAGAATNNGNPLKEKVISGSGNATPSVSSPNSQHPSLAASLVDQQQQQLQLQQGGHSNKPFPNNHHSSSSYSYSREYQQHGDMLNLGLCCQGEEVRGGNSSSNTTTAAAVTTNQQGHKATPTPPGTLSISPTSPTHNSTTIITSTSPNTGGAAWDTASPVCEFLNPNTLQQLLAPFCIREKGCSYTEVLESIKFLLHKYNVHTRHGACLNQLFHRADVVSVLGDWLTSLINTSIYTFEHSPTMTLIEMEILNKYGKELLGWSNVDGSMPPGGSTSNLYGIALARSWKFPHVMQQGWAPQDKPIFFTSEEGHYSSKKAAALLGIGYSNVVAVPSHPEQMIMTAEALEVAVREVLGLGLDDHDHDDDDDDDEECEGQKQKVGAEHVVAPSYSSSSSSSRSRRHRGPRGTPFCVVATLGTTLTGSTDPIAPIAAVCKKYNLWLHIDGCLGGALIHSKKVLSCTPELSGISQCDSIAINPHKMLGATLQCAVFLTKHKNQMKACFSTNAAYLFNNDKEYDSTTFDVGDKVFQCGRRVDALKLWLLWKKRGDDGMANYVELACERHQQFNAVLLETEPFLMQQNMNEIRGDGDGGGDGIPGSSVPPPQLAVTDSPLQNMNMESPSPCSTSTSPSPSPCSSSSFTCPLFHVPSLIFIPLLATPSAVPCTCFWYIPLGLRPLVVEALSLYAAENIKSGKMIVDGGVDCGAKNPLTWMLLEAGNIIKQQQKQQEGMKDQQQATTTTTTTTTTTPTRLSHRYHSLITTIHTHLDKLSPRVKLLLMKRGLTVLTYSRMKELPNFYRFVTNGIITWSRGEMIGFLMQLQGVSEEVYSGLGGGGSVSET